MLPGNVGNVHTPLLVGLVSKALKAGMQTRGLANMG
jgi:hypothetical protein